MPERSEPSERLELRVVASAAELVAHRMWELGAIAVEERAEPESVLLVAGFAAPALLHAAAASLPGSLVVTDNGAWRDAWKRFARPYDVDGVLTVVPAWCARPHDGHRREVVTIDPGNSFGLDHVTTRLCLSAVARCARPGMSVLDVGCGSGVIAIAAAAMGASRVVAIDFDEAAVRTTEANLTGNGYGSVVSASTTPLHQLRDSFDLVVANLGGTEIVVQLAAALIDRLAPAGSLVIGGILSTDVAPVRDALAALRPVEELERDGWTCLVSRR
jgi:ribosomal protein L11 methyltransferase